MNVLKSTSSTYVQNMIENMNLPHTLTSRTLSQAEMDMSQAFFVARHNFHVASKLTLHHYSKTLRYCKRHIFSFITCEVLRHAATFAAFVWYFKNTYSMNTYVLLHFEHKSNLVIIIKLHRATRLRLVALYRNFSWSKC